MPVPHHLSMLPYNRYEDLDDAPVDPVFDYEVDQSRGGLGSRRQQTPYYGRGNAGDQPRRSHPDGAGSLRAYSRGTPLSKSHGANTNSGFGGHHASDPDGARDSQPSRGGHRNGNGQRRRANQTYDLVRSEDLYADEDFVEYKNEPLYRQRNNLLATRRPVDPEPVNGRIADVELDDDIDDDDDDGMSSRMRLGDNSVHRGQLVTFYRNGDPIYKGLQTAISRRLFPTFETLIVWLNEKIQTTCGVRYIFSLATGKEVRDLGEFRAGEKYVVSSSRSLLRVNYGKNSNIYWRNKALSAGKIRKAELDIYRRLENANGRPKKSHSYPGSRAGSDRSTFSKYPLGLKPRILTIRNNLHRDKVQKVILNPKTTQSFEEMLRDIGEMLQVPGEERFEVQALYTAKPPYRKVHSFSQLADILGTLRTSERRPDLVCNEFIACGKEKFPTELLLKNHKHNKEARYSFPNHVHKQPALIPDTYNGDDEPAPPSESDRDVQDQSPTSGSNAEIAAIQQNGSVVDDPLGQSHDDFRQSQDVLNQSSNQSTWSRNPKQGQSPRSRATKRSTNKDKPFRKSMPEIESIKVHIHGHLREFFVPRYGQFDNEGLLPEEDVELNWVYGYRGTDAFNNLYTLISGELLYNVASVVVIYNKSREKQRHYTEHTEDITCITLLDEGASARVASGQKSNKYGGNLAHVRIWDPFSMTTQCVIGTNFFQNAVLSVAFSNYTGNYKKGSLLLTVDDSPRHMLSVWDWQKGQIIAKTPTSIDKVIWGAFHPDDHQTIITFGKQHIYFWWLDWKPEMTGTPRILRDKQSGLMPINDLPLYVTSIAFSPVLPSSIRRGDRPSVGEVITGDSNGCITVWHRDDNDAYVINHRCSEAMKHAHSKPVFSLCMMKEGTLLSAGGGEIKAWDTTNNYRPIKSRNIPEDCGTVRAMVPRITSSTDGTLYIGTTSNSILEGSLQEKFSVVVQGHAEELWALDTHPTEQVFVTAGYDQYVTKWSMQTHKPIWKSYVEKPGMSVAFSPNGTLIAVGTSLGRFIVLNAQNGQHITSVQVASDLEPLDGIKYSPDGRLLAMGCHDGNIYLYKTEDDGKVYRKYPHDRSGVLKGHSNSVQYLDWSNDSKYLQSVSADYDLLCWDIKQMKETPAEMIRDVEWATQTCVLNYNTLGAWSNLKEGEDITSLDRNKRMDVVAIGDNQGSIAIYRFPCSSEKPECHKHKAYSGRINKLVYSCDDRYLITSGGTDAGLMQWVVV